MQRKIKRLSEETINQIAAGEVVENPAFAIKELVENAIDAHASSIRVETQGGGFERICIIDDGCGMEEEDLLLCCERHTTSKIESGWDLSALRTMGFRGEALSSIAAISRISITSATGEGKGLRIALEGGQILHKEIAPRQRGTTIEVRDLFYNVPARKKFQKSALASTAEITRTMMEMALAHPRIGCTLIQGGQEIFSVLPSLSTPMSEALQLRIKDLLGSSFLEASLPCASSSLWGFIENPSCTGKMRASSYLFVNARPVHAPSILDAIRYAYGTRLDKGRMPRFVLHLEIEPAHLDVNVHPQKREVRFHKEEELMDHVQTAIASILNRASASWEICSIGNLEGVQVDQPSQSLLSYVVAEDENPSSWMQTTMTEKQIHAIGMIAHYLLIDARMIGRESGLAIVNLRTAEAALHGWYLSSGSPVAVQGLLIGRTLSMTSEESNRLEMFLEKFQEMGFVLRPFGKTTYLLEAIPSFLEEEEAEKIIREVIHGDTSWSREQVAKKAMARFRQRNKSYTQAEGERIVEELLMHQDVVTYSFEERILRVIEEKNLV